MKKFKRVNIANVSILVMFIVLNLIGLYNDKLIGFFKVSKYEFLLILNFVVFFIPALIVAFASKRKVTKALKLKRFRLKWVPLTVSLALVATLGGVILNTVVIKLFGIGFENIPQTSMGSVQWGSPLWVFVAIVLVPAVAEELFFRGAFLSYYGDKSRAVLIVCSLFFAFLHSSPYSFFAPLFAAVIYCLLTCITNSVFPAITAHVINNLIYCLIWYYGDAIIKAELENLAVIVFVVVFFIALLFSLYFIEPYVHLFKKEKKVLTLSERRELSKGKRNPYTLALPATFVLWLLKIILQITGFWG